MLSVEGFTAWQQRVVRVVAVVGCALGLLMGWVSAAHAGGVQALERFLRETQYGSATFTQTQTSPGRQVQGAAQPPRQRVSTGEFVFDRPNRFRFEYQRPFPQLIVADGQRVWLYDPDLQQATVREQAKVLADTPAMLIAASPDLSRLRQAFDLADWMPDMANTNATAGLQWVQATPKVAGQLQHVRMGFKVGATVDLVELDIVDNFGQRSQLRFVPSAAGRPAAERFSFRPPPGTDVIQQ
jgi:outer membrane lipoprotein carrier protein